MANLLTVSVQGGIVILAVAALRMMLKKAPKRLVCLLWLLAGLRLLLPFQIESSLSLQPNYNRGSVWEGSQTIVAPEDHSGHGWGEILDAQGNVLVSKPLEPIPGRGEILDSQGNVLVSEPLGTVSQIPNTEKTETNWKNFLPYIWVLGMVAMGASSVIAYLRLKKRVRDSVILSDGVWVTGNIDTAFVLGFFRPQVYLPVWLAEDHREFVLAHERSHIARRDHWWKLLGYLTLSIHWFNPLVWLGYILLCRDLEMACDENVVKTMDLSRRKAYSAALVSCSAVHPTIAACPVAFGEVSVKERVKNVLNFKKPGFWISLTAILAAILVAVFLLTSPGKEQEETLRAGYKGPGEEYTYFHSTEREKKWEEDVLFLAKEMLTKHPTLTDAESEIIKGEYYFESEYSDILYDAQVRQAFIDGIDTLIPKLGQWSDEQIPFEINKVIAKVGDSGTILWYDREGEGLLLDLDAIWAEGEVGFYVIRIAQEHKDLIFGKLTAINGTPIETVIERMLPCYAYKNEQWAMQWMVGMDSYSYLTYRGALAAAGVVEPGAESADLTFLTDEGEKTVTLEFMPAEEGRKIKQEYGSIFNTGLPPYRYLNEKDIWCEVLEDAVYMQIIELTFGTRDVDQVLIETVNALRDAEKPMKLIIDLRLGALGSLEGKRFESFARQVNQYGNDGVYILIGSESNYHAPAAAYLLKKWIDGAIIVGSPAAEGVNRFVYAEGNELPNTRLWYAVHERYSLMDESMGDGVVQPDITIYQTLEDYKNGIDTVFEAAVNGLQREFDIFLGTATMVEEEKEFDVSLGTVTVTEPEE